MDTYAYDAGLPCRNPHCKSHGKPHPNCRCYSNTGEAYAKGGSVCHDGVKHMPDCIYYADGGPVPPPLYAQGGMVHDHHSAVHHGFLGILKDVGHSKMADSDKHNKTLDQVKDHMSQGNHGKASKMLDGHALMGSSLKKHAAEIVNQLTPAVMSQDPNPDALKNSAEFLNNTMRGHDKLEAKMGTMLGSQSDERIMPDKNSREALKAHLDDLKQDPSKLFDVGGNIGHYLPQQAANLAATAAAGTQYFANLKPVGQQAAPLDTIQKPGKINEEKYNRQIDIAQQPLSILQHVKDGTLQPTDLVTLQTIYPGLHKSILEKAGEALIKAKDDGVEIPYKQKRSLSMLMGQPLDSTMTTQSMQAIMAAQGPQQMNNQAKKQPKKATDVELKQINKVDSMYQTPTQSRLLDRKTEI